MKFIKFFLLLLIVSKPSLAKDFTIISSINPIYQIVLAITQDKNNSILIIDPNVSEHDYQLKKSDAAAVEKSDLIFYVDNNLEKNFAKLVKRKNSYQLSQIAGIKILPNRNNPKINDYHLWMNPQNGVVIAEFVTKKICEINLAKCDFYQKNLQNFKQKISQSEKLIAAEIQNTKHASYVFYHDSYQYFEQYFGLNPVKIISNGHEEELTVKNLREFDRLSKNTKIECVFGDAFDEKNSAKNLAKNYKIKFLTLDVMGAKFSYDEMLRQIAIKFSSCISDVPSPILTNDQK
jgi:zinc transport system substrate-binding protein